MSNTDIKAEELSEAELQWLNDQRVLCAQLVSHTLGYAIIKTPSVEELHQAFDRWIDLFIRSASKKRRLFSKKSNPTDPNTIALCFGVVFGDHIRAKTLLEWKIVTDDYGTDMMLYTPGKAGKYSDIINAPINMVAKRIESREFGWLKPAFEQTTQKLNEISGQN